MNSVVSTVHALAGNAPMGRNICCNHGCKCNAVVVIEGQAYCGAHHYGVHPPTAKWIDELYFQMRCRLGIF